MFFGGGSSPPADPAWCVDRVFCDSVTVDQHFGHPSEQEARSALTDSDYAGAVVLADSEVLLSQTRFESVDLIYIDPPFNTRRVRRDRKGEYQDSFADLSQHLSRTLHEAKRVLKLSGSIYLHCDWREAHYLKVHMDSIFGRDCFLNEIIWAYDFGGR